MATKEVIEKLIPKIVPGCTFIYNSTKNSSSGKYSCTFTTNKLVCFKDSGGYISNASWDFSKYWGMYVDSFSDFKYPDGSSMEGPPLTREERVAFRCQKLWNNSKYVKAFPQQAY